MNFKAFLLFITFSLSIEAGEKRSYDGYESDSKWVKLTSTIQEIQGQAIQASIAAEKAAAASADETLDETQLENYFIKAIERFLIGKVRNASQIEHLLKRCPSLITTLDKKIELRTFFSELNRSIIHQILGHRLVDPATQRRYAVDLPLFETLVKNGLDLKKYPNLINDSLCTTTIIAPETLLFLMQNGATINLTTLISAINNRREIGYDNSLIYKMIDHYIVINGKKKCMQELEQTTTSLIDKRNEASLSCSLWLQNFINKKIAVEQKSLAPLLTQFLTRSITNAKSYKVGTQERREALRIIHALLSQGADPRNIDPSSKMNALTFAQSIGEKDIVDIIQNSVQSGTACQ